MSRSPVLTHFIPWFASRLFLRVLAHSRHSGGLGLNAQTSAPALACGQRSNCLPHPAKVLNLRSLDAQIRGIRSKSGIDEPNRRSHRFHYGHGDGQHLGHRGGAAQPPDIPSVKVAARSRSTVDSRGLPPTRRSGPVRGHQRVTAGARVGGSGTVGIGGQVGVQSAWSRAPLGGDQRGPGRRFSVPAMRV